MSAIMQFGIWAGGRKVAFFTGEKSRKGLWNEDNVRIIS